MPTLQQLLYALLAVTLLVAVVSDLKRRRIPDLLTFPAVAVALGLRLWLEGTEGWSSGLFSGLLGLGAAVAWFGAFALSGRLGWGDVKLAAVMGASLGVPRSLYALVFISLAGALQAIVSLIWQGALSDTVRGVLAPKPGGQATPGRHIPYGVAIALGSVWAMLWDGNAF